MLSIQAKQGRLTASICEWPARRPRARLAAEKEIVAYDAQPMHTNHLDQTVFEPD